MLYHPIVGKFTFRNNTSINFFIQNGVIIHSSGADGATIEADVVVGHGAIIHGCHIEHGALIGMGAVVLDGAVVESGALVAAGAVITPGTRVTGGKIWAGCPAKAVAPVPDSVREFIEGNPEHYRAQENRYLSGHVKPVTP